ncbi:MAG: FAD-dependent oxidoreductase, partial [Rhodocyclaceae bacterium]
MRGNRKHPASPGAAEIQSWLYPHYNGGSMTASIATNPTILVVGGGIAGMTAALEAAECGKQVILAEKSPTLGGRTSMLYRYFPKMCHP